MEGNSTPTFSSLQIVRVHQGETNAEQNKKDSVKAVEALAAVAAAIAIAYWACLDAESVGADHFFDLDDSYFSTQLCSLHKSAMQSLGHQLLGSGLAMAKGGADAR